jgi:hypothetical protein
MNALKLHVVDRAGELNRTCTLAGPYGVEGLHPTIEKMRLRLEKEFGRPFCFVNDALVYKNATDAYCDWHVDGETQYFKEYFVMYINFFVYCDGDNGVEIISKSDPINKPFYDFHTEKHVPFSTATVTGS